MAKMVSLEHLKRAIQLLEEDPNAVGTILEGRLEENAEKWAKENGWFIKNHDGMVGLSKSEEELPSDEDFENAQETMNFEDVLDGIFEHLFDEEKEEMTLEEIKASAEKMRKAKKLGNASVVINGTPSEEIVTWLKENGFVTKTMGIAFVFAESEEDIPSEEELENTFECGLAFSSFIQSVLDLS